jgi:N-acetylglucosaminyldiphosphoundecaprenol N-acetyl-beta-D-mannosaminyltransferase
MKHHCHQREVLCLSGIPLDMVTLADATTCVREAISQGRRLFISTPNLHFLTLCRFDPVFRQTLRDSDLCVVDGMPLVWASYLLGARLPERVAGSDLFEKLHQDPVPSGQQPIRVYFYGGLPGAADAASAQLNKDANGMVCVGVESPGFGSAEDLSTAASLEKINLSKADFLVVALESGKAQTWIQLNRHRLTIPVICNLGAVINFQSGYIKRAPRWMQQSGMEWLWRIKEEPALWHRYWLDLNVFTVILVSKILPYAVWLGFRKAKRKLQYKIGVWVKWMQPNLMKTETPTSTLEVSPDGGHATLAFFGAIDQEVPEQIYQHLIQALSLQIPIVIELKDLTFFGPCFAGRLLRFMTSVQSSGHSCQLTNVSTSLHRLFVWNGIL